MSDGNAGDRINVTFTCLKCGGHILSVPDDHNDDSPVTCKGCGNVVGTLGEVKAAALDVAAKPLNQKLDEITKRFPWIRRT